jgi:hypothetical protein
MKESMESFAFTEGSVTLNAAQAAIVRSDPRQNQRILASAGSGKTTTLTARIAWLLTNAGARPENIILLTFTHNAATVMKERLEALVGPTPLLCGTFHALSQQLLRRVNPESLEEVYHVDELPLKALDYLTKPVRLERLQAMLQKVERIRLLQQGSGLDLAEEFLTIQTRGRLQRLPLAQVLYVKAELKYLTVRSAADQYLLEGSLTELEERHGARLIRIHRSALVARAAVRALDKVEPGTQGSGWALRVYGLDELLPVSRRQLAAVREAFGAWDTLAAR